MSKIRHKGQGIIEVLVGSIVMIIVGLFLLDVTAVVLAATANDHLAKTAARAAANHDKGDDSKAAALKVIAGFPQSAIIPKASMSDTDGFSYQYPERVAVRTKMAIHLPAPLAVLPSDISLFAEAHEPILVRIASSSTGGPGGGGGPSGGPGGGGGGNDDDEPCDHTNDSGNHVIIGPGGHPCKQITMLGVP